MGFCGHTFGNNFREEASSISSRRYGIWEKILTISLHNTNSSPFPAWTQVCRKGDKNSSMHPILVTGEATLKTACCNRKCIYTHTWEALGPLYTELLFLLPGECRGWRMVSRESLLLKKGPWAPSIPFIFPNCTFQSGSGAESSGPQWGSAVLLVYSKSPSGGALRWQKDESVTWTEKGRRGMLEENWGGLTVHIESIVSLVAAHVAGGCAAVGAAVTLVEEGEDQGALLDYFQG